MSTGEYVIMLGDDDALMPSFFTKIVEVAHQFNKPDVIYIDAYIYAYPEVFENFPAGYLATRCNPFFATTEPCVVSMESRAQLVGLWMSFKDQASFNMQFSILRAEFIQSAIRHHRDFFQSLFPDYYATTICFLTAPRVVIYQQPLVIIGINKKSHGFYFLRNQLKVARQVLHAGTADSELENIKQYLLPGDWLTEGWLSAMVRVQQNCPAELAAYAIRLNMKAYRQRTIRNLYSRYYRDHLISSVDFKTFTSALSLSERIWGIWLTLYYSLAGLLTEQHRKTAFGLFTRVLGKSYQPMMYQPAGKAVNILEVFEQMNRGHVAKE